MDLYDLAASVFFGNLLTAMCIYGVWVLSRHEKGRGDWSWVAWGCAIFPFAFLALVFVSDPASEALEVPSDLSALSDAELIELIERPVTQ